MTGTPVDMSCYRRLALAILADAAKDFRGPDKELQHAAEVFFFHKAAEPVLSFWCLVAELNPIKVRMAMRLT